MFASNEKGLMEGLKHKIQERFDVKLYDPLKSLIRWKIKREERGIKVCHRKYAKSLLNRFGLSELNPVITRLGIKEDLKPTSSTD